MKAVLVVLIGTTLSLAGCSTMTDSPEPNSVAVSESPSPSPAAEPRTAEAAKLAAARNFDAYAAGDWAGAWDEWTAAGKAAVPRADYVKYHATCKTLTGLKFTITAARLEGTDRAVIRTERGGFAFTYELRYEDGRWRFQPDAEAMADYRQGLDKMIAKRKADGQCG